jgi:uncharacterized protein YbbK (DUF523 family)
LVLIVSACLLGLNTKYSGGHNLNQPVLALARKMALAPVCPEQLGGLPTPRPSAEIAGGDGYGVLAGRARVITEQGEDRTAAFLLGANETLKAARAVGAVAALLKARSPSCGRDSIPDGTFTGAGRQGAGVTTALLAGAGIPVFCEYDLAELAEYLNGLK